jgi:hypothetical protein
MAGSWSSPHPLAIHADGDLVALQVPVKSSPVNWVPWSVLQISGFACAGAGDRSGAYPDHRSVFGVDCVQQ